MRLFSTGVAAMLAVSAALLGTPARADDLLLGPRARQQLVNDIVRELAADLIRHAVQDPRRGRRLAWRLTGAHPDQGTTPSLNQILLWV